MSEANIAQNIEAQRSIFLLFTDETILANLVNISTLKAEHKVSTLKANDLFFSVSRDLGDSPVRSSRDH